jgi:iron(III)-salmochelin esterase
LVARQKNPALSFRLLTSDGDFFLASTRAISQALRQAGVPHELVVVPGPHDYPFNRGPAVYEMLVHHDLVHGRSSRLSVQSRTGRVRDVGSS